MCLILNQMETPSPSRRGATYCESGFSARCRRRTVVGSVGPHAAVLWPDKVRFSIQSSGRALPLHPLLFPERRAMRSLAHAITSAIVDKPVSLVSSLCPLLVDLVLGVIVKQIRDRVDRYPLVVIEHPGADSCGYTTIIVGTAPPTCRTVLTRLPAFGARGKVASKRCAYLAGGKDKDLDTSRVILRIHCGNDYRPTSSSVFHFLPLERLEGNPAISRSPNGCLVRLAVLADAPDVREPSTRHSQDGQPARTSPSSRSSTRVAIWPFPELSSRQICHDITSGLRCRHTTTSVVNCIYGANDTLVV